MNPRAVMQGAARAVMQGAAACVLLAALGLTAVSQPSPPSVGQPAPPPVAEDWAAVRVPARDRVDLARRLWGRAVPPPPTTAPVWAVGDTAQFYVTGGNDGSYRPITARLRALGEHGLVWSEAGADAVLSDETAAALAAAFDARIYPGVRALWGWDAETAAYADAARRDAGHQDADGDPRVSLLFARGLGGPLGYFSSDQGYPRAAVPFSSERDLITLSLDALEAGYALSTIESVIAHEYQHLLRFQRHVQAGGSADELWLNEALSQITQARLYDDPLWHSASYRAAPHTQVNTWAEDPGARSAHYGAAVYLLAFADALQPGEADLRAIAAAGTVRGFDALAAAGAGEADVLFPQAAAALMADYPAAEHGTPPPFERTVSLAPYALDWVEIEAAPGAQLHITLEGPAEAPLFAAETDGAAWYSVRADMADTRLTARFDLTGRATAAFEYAIWHHLEDGWDFAYLLASRDGEMWEPLSAAGMLQPDTETPSDQLRYGPAYAGASAGWRAERVSLDAYAGAPVWLRFEVITDDGINLPGVAVDGLSVSADGEPVSGAWVGEGWLVTDNRVPVRYSLLAAAPETASPVTGEAVVLTAEAPVSRVVTVGPGGRVRVGIVAHAPVTTERLPLRLRVRAAAG
jgi:hypothetical protein